MKEWRYPFGKPPESVFLFLDDDYGDASRSLLQEWLEQIVPDLNWRSHIFVVGGVDSGIDELTHTLPVIAGKHLDSHRFASVNLHPQVHLHPAIDSQLDNWASLLAAAKPYQREAHELLSEARLHISPVLTPTSQTDPEAALEAVEFFRARLAIPSFYLRGDANSELVNLIDVDEARFFVDSARLGLPTLLWRSHVFETILERVEDDTEPILDRCTPHLVVDEGKGCAFSCFYARECRRPGTELSARELPALPTGGDCTTCIAESALAMRANLLANRRGLEGRRVFFKLSLELAGRGQMDTAADLARAAFEFSRTDADRTAALIQQALCLRELGQLQQADEALEKATEFSADAGEIAYHRGRVQFVWRDYIEALEWFEQALESGSSQVPVEDMCFEMALCHINIEEYPEARPYLDRSHKPGDVSAPVLFYRGICDYGENRYEQALSWFREALAARPAPEDLSRVLFYIGACLKELEHFGEAVESLREAVSADPTDIANHNLLGFCYYKLQRHEEAVACFLRAVEIDPKSGIDWANLASNLRDLGKTKEAILMYKKALSLDPTIGFARENLKKLAG